MKCILSKEYVIYKPQRKEFILQRKCHKIATMDTLNDVQEDVVDPLKPRVRFLDEVEKISYDSSDEKNLDDRSYDIEMNAECLNEVTNQVENLSLENASSDNINSVFLVEPVLDPSDFNIDCIGNSVNKDDRKPNINENKRRARRKLYNQKQSSKINSILAKNPSYSSATELISKVFKAWCDVKSETKSVETTVSNEKNILQLSHKLSPSNGASLTRKKSKTEAQKKEKKETIAKFPSAHQEKSKNSKEEIEMAFKAWKKKKDEILKQKMSEKLNKEQELIVDSLMGKEKKKIEAGAAFNALKLHKSHATKMEKDFKTLVMLQKEEEEEKRIVRDREALIAYHMWLENKSSVKHNTFSPVKAKPPWKPPGK